MTVQSLADAIERLGGTTTEVGGRTVPTRFARPDRGHLAVRNGVGVTVHPWGLLAVGGDDSHAFLDNTLTCRVPTTDGSVSYGFLLDPDGRIETDLYVAATGDRYLCLTAPGTAGDLAAELGDRTFIQDVTVEDVTADHAVLGVHGPASSTKLASVMPEGEAPSAPLTLGRGVVREQGVTLLRLDAPVGETGIAVVCRRDDGGAVLDALVSLGAMAAPIGYETWQALTIEAGTPSFESELAGRTPNVCGQLPAGVALDKGCFIGQEVVARVANLGAPREHLVGLQAPALPEPGTPIETATGRTGVLTRRAESPVLDEAIGMAVVPAATTTEPTVTVDGREAALVRLPFVEGGEPSGRVPRYPDAAE